MCNRCVIHGLLLLVGGLASQWCLPLIAVEPITLAGATMGTTYSIKIASTAKHIPSEKWHAQIEHLLDEFDRRFSTYRPDSEISRVQQAATTEWQPISPELHNVLSLAREVQSESRGAFDITVAPLRELWGFGKRQPPPKLPSREEISAALESCGLTAWELRADPPAFRKIHSRVRFDLNALAPGYAVDCLVRLLASHGERNFCVELGGEIRASGNSPSGKPWHVGIEQPGVATGENRLAFSLPLYNRSLATSGDSRNHLAIAGQRYSHVLDPHSGEPLPFRGDSVTVIAEDCITADAWATALCVLGPEVGIAVANERQLTACFLVHGENDSACKRICSQRFESLFPELKAAQSNPGKSSVRNLLLAIFGVGLLAFLATRFRLKHKGQISLGS